MNTLVIYDNTGYIISETTGGREPQGGIQFMYVDIPQGKRLVSIDTTVTPHVAILEDIPPSEIEVLKAENASVQETLDLILTEIIPSLTV